MHSLIGKTASDAITGFEGVIIGFCEYRTGCNQLLVQPKAKDFGATWVESRWIDEQRLVVSQKIPALTLENEASYGFDKPAPRR